MERKRNSSMANLLEKLKKLEVRRHGNVEEKNRRLDICSTTTNPKKELGKQEH